MSLQELVDYCDTHPRHQEEIPATGYRYWQMGLDEMIVKLRE